MRIHRKLVAAVFAFALLLPSASGAIAAQRIALVIGNNHYQNLPKLEKALADAASYADALKAKGFDQVVLKTDLTREQMDETIAAFIEEIQPAIPQSSPMPVTVGATATRISLSAPMRRRAGGSSSSPASR
jgi:hypothetical protein